MAPPEFDGPFHTKEILREDVPCGKAVTTRWLDAQGNVLRQDCRIEVSAEALAAAGVMAGGMPGTFN